jgi:hypothetical protein
VHLSSLAARILFWIRELFSGGRAANDQRAFEAFYARMRESIRVLREDLLKGASPFSEVQTALKIHAKIANSAWGKNVEESSSFIEFSNEIEGLRLEASQRIGEWDGKEKAIVRRWIESTIAQRRFAAFLDLKEVPYRYSEIPRGAVILTDPRMYLQSAHLRKNGSLSKAILVRIKAVFCWFTTGKRYTHAELSLGKGESFDLDKKEGFWLKGEMKIQSRGERICYGPVLSANEEKMLESHQRLFRERGWVPFETFDDLWAAIDAEARRSAPLIGAGIFDLIRVGIPSKRPADYDPMEAWKPGEKQYACSATTSALLSKFGIDIGKQFDKKDLNVSPSDFLASEYFNPIFVPN